MTKEEKGRVIAGLHEKFTRSTVTILTEFQGMEAGEMTELRRLLRDDHVELKVVKNRLAKRAAEGTPMVLAKDRFRGQLALAIGFDSPIIPAKVIDAFITKTRRHDKLRMVIGVVDGKVVDADTVKALASLPGRPALLGMVLLALQGPIQRFLTVLGAPMWGFVNMLHALTEQKKGMGVMAEVKEETTLTDDQILGAVEQMSVLRLSELIKKIEGRFGVTAAVPMTMPMAGAGAATPQADVEEKTSFDVILKSAGEKKIQVIKAVREITNLGLKEAKDLVEGAPKPVKTGVPKEEGEAIKKKLEEQGASVEIQ